MEQISIWDDKITFEKMMLYPSNFRLEMTSVESINMRICELITFKEKEDTETQDKIEELKNAAVYLIEVEKKINI